MSNILIVSPHPDDETLGCAGTMLSHIKNKDKLFWLIMTKIKTNNGWSKKKVDLRKKEINKISKFFKFKDIINFDYDTTNLDKVDNTLLINNIKKILHTIKPEFIYLPFINDPHSDHVITSNAFNSCIKPFRQKFLKKVLMYETLSETNLNFLSSRQFHPNVYVDITKFIDQKIKAMQIYGSEISNHPFPRSPLSIKSLAALRGSQVNLKYAEGFQLVYEILS